PSLVLTTGRAVTGGREAEEALRQAPELARQFEPLENRRVLLARVGLPVRRDAVAPPRVRELAQLRDRDRGARRAASEPAGDVLLRPEEVHRASGEDDVVPPVRRGDEAMEEQRVVVGLLVADVDGHRLAAVGARRLDPAVDVQRGADAERVPRAV